MSSQLSSNICLHCLRCKRSTYSNRAVTILRRSPYKWLRGYDSDNNMCFPGKRVSPHTYSTAQFKLYTHVQVHACACTFNACKITKMACARTVACDFGMRTRDT